MPKNYSCWEDIVINSLTQDTRKYSQILIKIGEGKHKRKRKEEIICFKIKYKQRRKKYVERYRKKIQGIKMTQTGLILVISYRFDFNFLLRLKCHQIKKRWTRHNTKHNKQTQIQVRYERRTAIDR